MNDSGGTAVIGVIIGAVLVLLIGLYAFGVFGPAKDATTVNVDTTAPVVEVPTPAPETTPPEPAPAPSAEPTTPDSTPPVEPPPLDQPTEQPTEPAQPPAQ